MTHRPKCIVQPALGATHHSFEELLEDLASSGFLAKLENSDQFPQLCPSPAFDPLPTQRQPQHHQYLSRVSDYALSTHLFSQPTDEQVT